MEGQTVYIHPDAISAILAHATAEAPRECCGLLVGRGNRIERAAPAANVDPAPERRFLVDPEACTSTFDASCVAAPWRSSAPITRIRSSPAEPSTSDVEEASYPEFVHLIVSLLPPAAGSPCVSHRSRDCFGAAADPCRGMAGVMIKSNTR